MMVGGTASPHLLCAWLWATAMRNREGLARGGSSLWCALQQHRKLNAEHRRVSERKLRAETGELTEPDQSPPHQNRFAWHWIWVPSVSCALCADDSPDWVPSASCALCADDSPGFANAEGTNCSLTCSHLAGCQSWCFWKSLW